MAMAEPASHLQVQVWVGWGGTRKCATARGMCRRVVHRMVDIPSVSSVERYVYSSSDHIWLCVCNHRLCRLIIRVPVMVRTSVRHMCRVYGRHVWCMVYARGCENGRAWRGIDEHRHVDVRRHAWLCGQDLIEWGRQCQARQGHVRART